MQSILSKYDPITLDEMKDIRLMNRIDTKFIATTASLTELLEMASHAYRMQETGGERNMSYHTTYFDTTDYRMFYAHQAGHANRQKVRFRTYVGSNLQFLEVKTKNNHGRTKKKRIEVGDMDLSDDRKQAFLSEHLHCDTSLLLPCNENSFNRITLVNRAKTDRLTIDTHLCFRNLLTGCSRELPNLAVIELKRDGLSCSPVLEMLRLLRIHPHGFSKYCIGSALTNGDLRVNRFKPKLREIGRFG